MSNQVPPLSRDDEPKKQEPQETKRVLREGRFWEEPAQLEASESRRVVPTVRGPARTFAFDSMESVVGVVVGIALAVLWLFVFSKDRTEYDLVIRVCGYIWGAGAAFVFGYLLVTWLIYGVIAALLMAVPGAIIGGLIGAIFGGSRGFRNGAGIGALIFGTRRIPLWLVCHGWRQQSRRARGIQAGDQGFAEDAVPLSKESNQSLSSSLTRVIILPQVPEPAG